VATQEEQAARLVWQYGEPIHAVVFFAPETEAATEALGLKGGWMSYFGCRAAPLGAVSAAVVTSVFYGFHPRMVERSIPDAWALAEPRQLIDARLSAMDAALRRVLGEAVAGPDVRRAASLAMAAVGAGDFSGRPLGAANAALDDPGAPHLQLWQALGAIREHRGDGHVSCLVTNEVDPCASLVMQAATDRSDRETLRTRRGWSEEEWRAAVERLRERGWLDEQERPTPAGVEAREAIEAATDRLSAPLVGTLGTRASELVEAMRPLAERIMGAGEVPVRNNMGLPWPGR
jgi:helix-turn-helix protein